MKRILFLILIPILLLTVVACQSEEPRDKPLVMTTLFPYYDVTKTLAGDLVDVTMILPLGGDSHHYEPSPKQITAIKKADLIVFTGLEMEPWMKGILKNSSLSVLNLSEKITLEHHDDDHHHDHDHGHHHDHDDLNGFQRLWNTVKTWLGLDAHDEHDYDPHFWLDPIHAQIMVEEIAHALILLVPESEELILTRKDALNTSLSQLHLDYLNLFETHPSLHLMHAGHNAFSYFARRYNISYHTPYEGFTSDAEPKPQALAEMLRLMEKHNIRYLYAEVELNPLLAKAIQEQTGTEILYLYNAETISSNEMNQGLTFLDMMIHNFNQIKRGVILE